MALRPEGREILPKQQALRDKLPPELHFLDLVMKFQAARHAETILKTTDQFTRNPAEEIQEEHHPSKLAVQSAPKNPVDETPTLNPEEVETDQVQVVPKIAVAPAREVPAGQIPVTVIQEDEADSDESDAKAANLFILRIIFFAFGSGFQGFGAIFTNPTQWFCTF